MSKVLQTGDNLVAQDGAHPQHSTTAASQLNRGKPIQFDWNKQETAISLVQLLTIRMSDESAARAVIERFPELPIPDPHAAAIFDARRKALQGTHGELIEERAKSIITAKAFESDVQRECLDIFETHISTAKACRNPRAEALQHAAALYRLENPVFPCTDAGNGERFAFHNYERARYISHWKKWLVWNGRFWEKDETGVVSRLAKETARKIPDEAKGITGEKYTHILKHAITTEANSRLNAMLERAASEEGMTIRASQLDSDEWLFNCQNGTFDLRHGQFRNHDQEDFLTKISPVIYDEKATCPQFDKFLHEIFDGSQALCDYFARVVGYSLTGDTREQIFIVLHGSGSNGKSLLLKVLGLLFGDYSHTMEPSAISTKYGDKMATDIAELFGKRFVVSSESNDGRRLDEGMVKRMTGGEELTGERKFENPFTFTPQFQIFFCTNHKPEIRGTDNGIWRRVQLVPFNVTYWSKEKGEKGPKHLRADSSLFTRLENELPGIFNWALNGFIDWRKSGLGTPREVLSATADYRAEQDTLGDFLKEKCVRNPSATVAAGDLYLSFTKWSEENGQPKISATALGKKLRERGFMKDEKNKKRPYLGIGLLENDS